MPLESHGARLLARVHRVTWAEAPTVGRPVGRLPSDPPAALDVVAGHMVPPMAGPPCPASAGPRALAPSPAPNWLLVGQPLRGAGPLCLQASASPLAGFTPGRAAVNPDDYRLLRDQLPGGSEVFLQSGGHLLLV